MSDPTRPGETIGADAVPTTPPPDDVPEPGDVEEPEDGDDQETDDDE